jgi:hypothetical protein
MNKFRKLGFIDYNDQRALALFTALTSSRQILLSGVSAVIK